MLLVKTHVAPSRIHGIGLFAAESIPSGALVWEFTLGLDRTFVEHDPQVIRHAEWFATYAWKLDRRIFVCLDNARFLNHSADPNLGGEDLMQLVALRDIAVDEELTEDYSYDDDFASYAERLK